LACLRKTMLPGACLTNTIGPLYTVPLPTSTTSTPHVVPCTLAATPSSTTWHNHLGHPGPDVLPTYPRGRDDALCHACQLGQHVWLPFPSSSHVVRPFDLIHYNIWTSTVLSVSGYKYYLVILDDCTNYSWIFLQHQKSNTFPTLFHFFTFVSMQFGCTIYHILCDNAHEFDNSSTCKFILSHNVQLRMPCPYTSPQNGKAESMIHTTYDVMHSLLF
jgi:hypothetical protein